MEINKSIIEAVTEMFQMFGLNTSLIEEVEESHQFSGDEVNVLIGLADGLKGNIVLGFKRATALSIVSAMMGGMEVSDLDFMSKSALGELANMTIGSAIMKLMWSEVINLSPPTVVMGEDMTLTLSGNNSTRIKFNLNNEIFNIIISTDRV